MTLFVFGDGGSHDKIEGLDGKKPATFTVLDVNRACLAHAKAHSFVRTRSVIGEITGDPNTMVVHILRDHRGPLIARLRREITFRPFQAQAHLGTTAR